MATTRRSLVLLRRTAVGLVIGLVSLGAAPAQRHPLHVRSIEVEIADVQIVEAVQRELNRDEGLSGPEIKVTAELGIVTLAGTVPDLRERWRAVADTEAIKGVRGVASLSNLLEVDDAAPRADSAIKADVQEALRWDALVFEPMLEVQVSKGAVKLGGSVGSLAERDYTPAPFSHVLAWVPLLIVCAVLLFCMPAPM